ncbi:hypothetical protein N657DRAFT_646885 [Parathielavia appendiculata]|uniref:Uncharacterized protein n=1 Tax=Parathielavia appendiculata TaxID=2587402 RepID=A0AAN6TX78_9PEZI|nr:hypothetical protein N657DRAFT_646885 [Parathielavia appendiculata]
MAATCRSSNVTPIEQFIGSGGGGSGEDVIAALSREQDGCRLRICSRTPPDSSGIGKSELTLLVQRSPMRTPDARLNNVAYVLDPRSDTVECTGAEMCLSIQTVPFCLDLLTYSFHASDGTTERKYVHGRLGCSELGAGECHDDFAGSHMGRHAGGWKCWRVQGDGGGNEWSWYP